MPPCPAPVFASHQLHGLSVGSSWGQLLRGCTLGSCFTQSTWGFLGLKTARNDCEVACVSSTKQKHFWTIGRLLPAGAPLLSSSLQLFSASLFHTLSRNSRVHLRTKAASSSPAALPHSGRASFSKFRREKT